jgi:hypothetical protein
MLGSFIGFGVFRFRNLLCQKTMAVAMGHGMLAQSERDMVLIETEECVIEWDRIDLQRNGNDTDPCR